MSLIDKAEEVAKEVVQEVEAAAEKAVEFVEGVFSDQGGLESSEGNANLDGEQTAAQDVAEDANGSDGGAAQGAAEAGNAPAASSDSTEQSGATPAA